jgi:hypothetical protein
MKFRVYWLPIVFLITSLMLTSCVTLSSQEELSVQDQAGTSVAETMAPISAAETIVALTLSARDEDEVPTEALEETPLVPPTDTPTESPPDQPTPTTTFTATLSVPMVEVSVNTNCRTGPGLVYDRVSALLIGQEAEVVARSADGAYWVIRNPSGSGTCWLWGFYATVQGPTAGLPVWDPPPTPTLEATITPTATITPSNTPAPTTYKTGPLEITQTWGADLDEGVIISGGTRDLKFEADTATAKFLTPQNGATIAIWGTSAPGMYDCLNASLSSTRIPIGSAPVGTYVCYLTNQGRPGAFRVNELTSDAMQVLKIGFTTWNAP